MGQNDKKKPAAEAEPPMVSIEAIDDVIHGRLRLGVMAYLSAVNPASFAELIKRTGATNGNLSTHLSKLEAAGYVTQEKGFKGKRPQTLVHLTDPGRSAWVKYLDTMRQMLGAD